jgi:hypothetical protein
VTFHELEVQQWKELTRVIATNCGQDQAHVRVQKKGVDVRGSVFGSVRDSARRVQRVDTELGLEPKSVKLFDSSFDAVREVSCAAP